MRLFFLVGEAADLDSVFVFFEAVGFAVVGSFFIFKGEGDLIFRDLVFAGVGHVAENRADGDGNLVTFEFIGCVAEKTFVNVGAGKLGTAGNENEYEGKSENESKDFFHF